MRSCAAASPSATPSATSPRQRRQVRGVLGVDGRLLVGQVVVERRARRRRDRRLHRGVRDDREREVVVRLVAALELRHGVVHRRLYVRHVDHAVGLDLRRRRRANRVDRVRVPGQHRVRRHHGRLLRPSPRPPAATPSRPPRGSPRGRATLRSATSFFMSPPSRTRSLRRRERVEPGALRDERGLPARRGVEDEEADLVLGNVDRAIEADTRAPLRQLLGGRACPPLARGALSRRPRAR